MATPILPYLKYSAPVKSSQKEIARVFTGRIKHSIRIDVFIKTWL